MAPRKSVALVTGGANGIGRATTRHLLDSGWCVAVIDLPDSGLRRAYPPRKGNVLAIDGDVRDEKSVAGAADAIVASAGSMPSSPMPAL